MRFLTKTFSVIFCLSVLFVVSSFAADVAKIGVIDLQRVLETSDAGKAAQVEITKKGLKMGDELKRKEEELVELKTRLDNEAMVMSRVMKEEKERELQIKYLDLKQLEKKFRADSREMNNRLSERIKEEIITVVEEIGKTGGYLIIIEKKVVHYYPNTIDVTDKLIKKYNLKYTKK
jgi:outer membrane protein